MSFKALAIVNYLGFALNIACALVTGLTYSYIVAAFCLYMGIMCHLTSNKNK